MTIEIPDWILNDSGFDKHSLVVEIACQLYNSEKIVKSAATHMTGLSRGEFEAELLKRGLPWIRVRDDDVLEDMMHARRAGKVS